MDFYSLHNHDYSSNIRFLDSINRPEEMIDKAIKLGFKGIAFTNHEALSSAVTILKKRDQIKNDHPDFKIIFGNEIYLIDESEIKNTNKYYHFILLAKDKEGWDQLRELSSWAWEHSYMERGQVRVPTTYQKLEEVVKKNPGHLIASSACLGSRIDNLILEHNVPEANKFVRWCIDLFGKNNFALELQPSDSEEQLTVNKVLIKMANYYEIPFIVTTDSHYLDKEDFKIHSAFLNSKQASDRETEKFYKFTYIMEEQEMIDILTCNGSGIDREAAEQAIKNTCLLGDQIEEFDFRHGTIVPKIRIPEFKMTKELYGDSRYPIINKFYDSNDEQDRYLMYQIERGIFNKKIIVDDIKKERIEKELSILDYISERLNQKLSAYLNLTVNIINLAWQTSLVAPGRGCFIPGQKVYLANGEIKNIEDVKIGDFVTTHLGKKQKVYNVLSYDCSEELYTIKSIGNPGITCTNNHEFFAIKNGKCKNSYYKNVYCTQYCKRYGKCGYESASISPVWISAENLQIGDYLCVPKSKFLGIRNNNLDLLKIIPHAIELDNDRIYFKDSHSKYTGFDRNFISERYLKITPELCKLIGYFIGNGWTSAGKYGSFNELGIAFHSEHTDKINDCYELIKKVLNAEPSVIYKKAKHCCQIIVYDKRWASTFEFLCGHLAINKKIPDFIFESEERAVACLKGLSLTDGSFSFKDSSFRYSTTSEKLQHQVTLLCNMLGFYCSTFTNSKRQNNWETEKGVKINGKYFEFFIKKCFPEYSSLIVPRKYNGTVIKEDEKYYYSRVTEISKKKYTGKVYDLSVEEDSSYNICGVAVHNSSTGFYINYLIGITQIDPFVYNLKEWRFLNKERVELPDIDSDFQPEKTEEIIKILRKEYGEDHVLNCATFKTESLKSAILSCGRGMGFNNDDMQALAALVPSHRGITYSLKDCLEGDEEKGLPPVQNFKEKVDAFPGLFEAIKKVEGIPTNASIHASALYVFNSGYLPQNSLMKAPNGTLITAFSMHDSDDMGALKMDVLRTDAQSKIAKCLDLLLKDGQIEWQGSLRETYNKYLHPDNLVYDDPKMWENMSNGSIQNLFQMDSPVGSIAMKKTRPENVGQLAEVNSIMRLQSDDGEQPIDRYVRFRNDINQWYLEMIEAGLNPEEIKVLEKYLLKSCGVSGSQEILMQILMDPAISGFTLGESNNARKIIAKKQVNKVAQLKENFFKKGKDLGARDVFLKYVWTWGIEPQLGYSFSINHTVPYSVVAVQEANLATRWNPLYWQCACLCVNAGNYVGDMGAEEEEESEEEENEEKTVRKVAPNYGKISKAIADAQLSGVKIGLPDINESQIDFIPDIKNNAILYSLQAINIVSDDLLNRIIENRPYKSITDFCEKVQPTTAQAIGLVKAGCFDKLYKGSRSTVMRYMLEYLTVQAIPNKEKITTVQLKKAIELKMPELAPYVDTIRLFRFKQYIDTKCLDKANKRYVLNEEACYKFFATYIADYLDVTKGEYDYLPGDGYTVKITPLKKFVEGRMTILMDWLNSKEGLDAYNNLIKEDYIKQLMEKYCEGSENKWEMDTMGFYQKEHELARTNGGNYHVVDFNNLPEDPEKQKISAIMGTIINVENARHLVSILTTTGVVDVKFYDSAYVKFNQKISKIDDKTKKKTVIDDTWFKRGNKILVYGVRREDNFVAKSFREDRYNRMVGLIEKINVDGTLNIRYNRYKKD